jgi:hypothetical protein
MYWRTIAGGAPPHGAEKYEGGHRCPCVRARLMRPVNSPPAFGRGGCLQPYPGGGDALEAVDQLGDGDLRRVVHQEVDVIAFAVELLEFRFEVLAHLAHDLFAACQHLVVEDVRAGTSSRRPSPRAWSKPHACQFCNRLTPLSDRPR